MLTIGNPGLSYLNREDVVAMQRKGGIIIVTLTCMYEFFILVVNQQLLPSFDIGLCKKGI